MAAQLGVSRDHAVVGPAHHSLRPDGIRQRVRTSHGLQGSAGGWHRAQFRLLIVLLLLRLHRFRHPGRRHLLRHVGLHRGFAQRPGHPVHHAQAARHASDGHHRQRHPHPRPFIRATAFGDNAGTDQL